MPTVCTGRRAKNADDFQTNPNRGVFLTADYAEHADDGRESDHQRTPRDPRLIAFGFFRLWLSHAMTKPRSFLTADYAEHADAGENPTIRVLRVIRG